MCEIQNYTIEHQDIYMNKYSECSNNMDLYITDSLQDMLDMDIKSEMATDLGDITDFSVGHTFSYDSLGLSFSEMPPLLDIDTDNSAWPSPNTNNFANNLDLYDSEGDGVLVNPSAVIPPPFVESPDKKVIKEESSNVLLTSAANSSQTIAPSLKEERSHLTFSPSTIKVSNVNEADKKGKKPLEEATQMVIYVRKDSQASIKDLLTDFDNKKMKSAQSTSSHNIRIKPQSELLKLNNKSCSVINTNQKVSQRISSKTIISGNIHILDTQSRTILSNGNKNATILINNSSLNTNGRQIIKSAVGSHLNMDNSKNLVSAFPKPAYSYSCLIAMALKNSRTGSLPVSEIYNFMCQHFPYFKTAPNGWKNSVRHNLSLNKCFEKIEKPSANGSQRKACLWAMNPSKVEKMDEEVQKWSRKDPQAIKDAMVFPDSLEALERGEMKYNGMTVAEGTDEVDDDVDVELENDEIKEEVDDVKDEYEEEAMDQESSSYDAEMDTTSRRFGAGDYRLITTAPSSSLDDSADEFSSDVEILHSYDEDELDLTTPVKLDLSFADEDYTEKVAKRPKSTFMYQQVNTTTHTNRRKTPLVNRVL